MQETIKQNESKSKGFSALSRRTWEEVGIVLIIILVAFLGFGLGRLSMKKETKTPVTIERFTLSDTKDAPLAHPSNLSNPVNSTNYPNPTSLTSSSGGEVVASKNGTKYHYPWCSGASKISVANKITFKSEGEAVAVGLTKASNCK